MVRMRVSPTPSATPSPTPGPERVAPGAGPGGDELRRDLVRAAARLVDSVEEAEDVVQEALLRHAGRAGPPLDSPRAWLVRVVGNLAVDRLRRRRLERAARSAGPDVPADGVEARTPDDELERAERCREAIARLLDGSRPHDVAAALLHEVFGTDYADIARAGGRTGPACRQTVRRALERARKRDRERDRREGAAPGPATREARADAVLDRFAHAVLDAEPAALFDALRIAASREFPDDAAGGRAAGPRARLRVEVGAGGARVVLALGGTMLCTVRRAARPRPAARP